MATNEFSRNAASNCFFESSSGWRQLDANPAEGDMAAAIPIKSFKRRMG
jgi:hypothetical protein